MQFLFLFTETFLKSKLPRSRSAIHKTSPKLLGPTMSMSDGISIQEGAAADEKFCLEARYCSRQLNQIHYYGRKPLPRQVFKIIASIIQFYPSLTNITIANGLDVYGIYEISKILVMSHITEVCFEHLNIKNAHYQLLVTEASNLNYLSLSKCSINDEITENIMLQLKHSLPASKTLLALNLSCNFITDNGAHFIGEALRSNRCLQYLNLASNMITDDGAAFIFSSLLKFPLTGKEVDLRDKTFIQYSTQKVKIMTLFIDQSVSQPKKAKLKIEKKVGKKSNNTKTVVDDTVGLPEHQEARSFAESILGSFLHPYDKTNIVRECGIEYCTGNNTLCYLNMAYNDLTIVSIRKLLHILTYQKIPERSPRGLTQVIIEGNPLPANCSELRDLNYFLDSFLNLSQKGRINRKPRTAKTLSQIPKT